MARKAPGKAHRKGLSIVELTRMFPDDEAAEKWFVQTRWPEGVSCPKCSSINVLHVKSRKPQPYRCRDCRKCFSVKVGTLMEGSNLGLQTWAIAFYLVATGLKGVSSMKLHRDLGVTQKTAWHLAHRIRETWAENRGRFEGPVEVDETYMGGKERNKHQSKKLNKGRGPVGKAAVIGMKDRETNQVTAMPIKRTDAGTLQGFVIGQVAPEAQVFTDEHRAYQGLPNHQTVKHSVGEYVDGQAHTNGIESFWSMLKRGYHGTYHRMSAKHLDRYVREFSGRHNQREDDTLVQMGAMIRNMKGKRLRYADLVNAPDADVPKAGSDVF